MDNKMVNLMAEIENAQKVADDVRNETAKMNAEIKKAKEERLCEIRKITEDFRELMRQNNIYSISTCGHYYLCGQMMYQDTTFNIITDRAGIRIDIGGHNNTKEVYTCMYGGTKGAMKLHQDFLLKNWDMFYEELIADFKMKFDNSLEDTHLEYENVVDEYNQICKGE